jgi:hypothetical protein
MYYLFYPALTIAQFLFRTMPNGWRIPEPDICVP